MVELIIAFAVALINGPADFSVKLPELTDLLLRHASCRALGSECFEACKNFEHLGKSLRVESMDNSLATRTNLDKPVSRKPPQCFPNRGARHAKSLRNRSFVQLGARRDRPIDDVCLDRLSQALRNCLRLLTHLRRHY